MTPIDDIENVKRVIQDSFTFAEAAQKLGHTQAILPELFRIAKEHGLRTKPIDWDNFDAIHFHR